MIQKHIGEVGRNGWRSNGHLTGGSGGQSGVVDGGASGAHLGGRGGAEAVCRTDALEQQKLISRH